MYQAWLDQRWPNAGLKIGPRCQTEGIGITPRRGGLDCSQSCSQFVTQSLPSVQLLATDIPDHPQAPLGRRVAEEGVEGSWSGANLALEFQKLRGADGYASNRESCFAQLRPNAGRMSENGGHHANQRRKLALERCCQLFVRYIPLHM